MRHQRHHRYRSKPAPYVVRAACEYDRHPRAEDNARAVGTGEVLELLGDHVSGLEIRHEQDVRLSSDRRNDLLGLRGFLADRIVESEWAVENASGDLSAVRHLAKRSSVERRLHLRV